MVRRRDRRHGHTEADGSDFGAVQKVGPQEANRDEGVEEVNEAASSDLRRAVLRAKRRRHCQCYHAASHTGSRDHEHGASAETVNREEGNEGGQELPSQGAASKGARILGIHAQIGLEDDGGVYRNQIRARHLLVKLQEHAKTEAVQELVLAHGKHVAELDLVSRPLLQRVLDTSQLGLHLHRVTREGLERRNDGARLAGTVLHDQPSRRLRQEVDRGNDHDGTDGANSDRGPPGDGTSLELPEGKVDPRLEGVSQTNEQSVNHHVAATVLGARRLALPYRRNGTQLANTKAQNDTRDNELSQAKRRGLENDANQGADGGDENDVAAAKLVAGPGAGQGSDHGTNHKSGDDEPLKGGVFALGSARRVDRVDFRESLYPVVLGQQAAQACLVVAKAHVGGQDDERRLQQGESVSILAQVCFAGCAARRAGLLTSARHRG